MHLQKIVEPAARGMRLDQWLGKTLPQHSRARWQQLIEGGFVHINGIPVERRHKLHGGEDVTWREPTPEPTSLQPENRPLDILFEDEDLLVLNKPAGVVVHPAPGHREGTLVHALLYHCDDLSGIGGEERPGIVHRLDRETSGLLLIAKNEAAHRKLAEQFKRHDVRKEYIALVWGVPLPTAGTVRTLIGRDPHHRKCMSTRVHHGREAVTHYAVVENLGRAAVLRVNIETGRTHQIRVHMTHLGHPVMGDALYGRRVQDSVALGVKRHMLHAARLSLPHPRTGVPLSFECATPEDMAAAMRALRAEMKPAARGPVMRGTAAP